MCQIIMDKDSKKADRVIGLPSTSQNISVTEKTEESSHNPTEYPRTIVNTSSTYYRSSLAEAGTDQREEAGTNGMNLEDSGSTELQERELEDTKLPVQSTVVPTDHSHDSNTRETNIECMTTPGQEQKRFEKTDVEQLNAQFKVLQTPKEKVPCKTVGTTDFHNSCQKGYGKATQETVINKRRNEVCFNH